MNSRTAKLISRYANMRNISSRILKRLWLSTPSPSRRLARAKMKADILAKLLDEKSHTPQIPGLHEPSERQTIDRSSY